MRKPNTETVMVHKAMSQRLRSIRELMGFTQQQVASELGITYQQYRKYESGQSAMPAPRLYLISKAFGVPIEMFYTDKDQQPFGSVPLDQI